jgi:small subunit ribosomal protein S21
MSVKMVVQDGNVAKALTQLKRKLGKEGVLGESRKRKEYEKPSDQRRRKVKAMRRRLRKA